MTRLALLILFALAGCSDPEGNAPIFRSSQQYTLLCDGKVKMVTEHPIYTRKDDTGAVVYSEAVIYSPRMYQPEGTTLCRVTTEGP